MVLLPHLLWLHPKFHFSPFSIFILYEILSAHWDENLSMTTFFSKAAHLKCRGEISFEHKKKPSLALHQLNLSDFWFQAIKNFKKLQRNSGFGVLNSENPGSPEKNFGKRNYLFFWYFSNFVCTI